MKAITFTLELLEPLMVTGLEGDPNSNVTLDYIPGSVIRGTLIARYIKKERNKSSSYKFDPANDTQNEHKLFFNGSVRYLNAYPSVGEARTLPTPLSWFAVKDAEPTDDEPVRTAYDLCRKSAKEAFPNEQNKPLGKPFFYRDGTEISLIKPEHRLAIHTQRERRHGRSLKEDGAVFRYEALEADSRFGGVILFDDDTLISEIEDLLKDTHLNLGGSRTAGYGRARILNLEKPTTWSETKNEPSKIEDGKTFTITLLSNALIRDDNGQYQADLSLEELKKFLGNIKEAKLGDDAENSSEEKFNATFKQTDIVGGFNRKWGLPLPQTISVKAGSVFTFKANELITQAKVKALIDAGIGERRVEGFGRIAVNLNMQSELSWKKHEEKSKVDERAITNGLSRGLARQMLGKLMRQMLDRMLLEKVANYQIKGKLPNHQISRLRVVVRESLRSGNKDKVKDFFDNNKRIAREHFSKARVSGKELPISGKELPSWATSVLVKQNEFTINPPALGKNDAHNKAVVADFTDELKLEYHLRLIDGVLAHAAKEND